MGGGAGGAAAGADAPAEPVDPDDVVVGADTYVTGASIAGSTITTRRVMRRITTCGLGRVLNDLRPSDARAGWSGTGAAPNTPTPVRNVASPVTQASARTRPRVHRFARGAPSATLRSFLAMTLALVVTALVVGPLGFLGFGSLGLLGLGPFGLVVFLPRRRVVIGTAR